MPIYFFNFYIMQKFIYFVCAIIVLYFISIFAFPSVSASIWEKLGLTWFNNSVIKARDDFNDFITNFDVLWKMKDTKDQALEIKQNVETQVEDTKKKIEVIQTNVDKTAKAIDDTTKAVNNTVNSLNELQNSIVDVVPGTASGNTQE